jgi:hypothetical protein
VRKEGFWDYRGINQSAFLSGREDIVSSAQYP